MNKEIADAVKHLATLLNQSEEYAEYTKAKALAVENDTTRALLKQYASLRMKAQANMVLGNVDDDIMASLNSLTQLLSGNKEASDFLVAEYRVTALLSYVYESIGNATDVNMGLDFPE